MGIVEATNFTTTTLTYTKEGKYYLNRSRNIFSFEGSDCVRLQICIGFVLGLSQEEVNVFTALDTYAYLMYSKSE